MTDSALHALAERRVGTTLKGKYRIDSILGMGGMAVVYAVTHARNNASLAVKMLHPELSYREDVRQRFLREGYAANTVAHPGVVMVVDDDEAEDGSVFVVMERLQGEPVDAIAPQLKLEDAVCIVDQLLDVLAAAHAKGIIHRDIKPANLFLLRDGTLKVLDFGIAKVRDALTSASGQVTGTGMLMGTPAFMSPEQALAKASEIDARSDVWAAGATLYTLASGRFVHEAENAPQMLVKAATAPAPSLATVVPSAPRPIVDVVARALAQDRAARFPSASAMREALREAHRAAFGTLPSRDRLAHSSFTPSEAALAPTAAPNPPPNPIPNSAPNPTPHSAPNPVPSSQPVAATMPLVATPVAARPSTATTMQPVSTRPAGVPSSRTPLVVGGVLVLLAALGVGGWKLQSKHDDSGADVGTSSGASTSSTPSSSDSSGSASAATVAPTSPSAPAASSASVQQRLSPHPSAAAAAGRPSAGTTASTAVAPAAPSVTAAASVSVKPPPTASSSAKPNCDPPYTIDDRGHRVYKPECLQQ